MDVGKLFSGIAVIIDDQINEDGSPISTMKKTIEKRDIPVATYETIPEKGVISSLVDAAFVILDWDFTHGQVQRLLDGDEETIKLGDTMQKDQDSKLIDFIRALTSSAFVPVFIFTVKGKEDVTQSLRDAGLWKDNKPNRIFVKDKGEVTSDKDLFGAIEGWIKSMPSVYALKEWERAVSAAKQSMLSKMYDCSPDWAKAVWKTFKQDNSSDCEYQFGDFMTRNCVNRINEYEFDEALFDAGNDEPDKYELAKIVEGERYFEYAKQPEQAYTGDLFQKADGEYYLNIMAQCDLVRNSDPVLYCIRGRKLEDLTKDIRLTEEEEMVFNTKDHVLVKSLPDICKDAARLQEFNEKFKKHRRSGIFLHMGEILEKKVEVIVPCVAGEKAIKFGIELVLVQFSEYKGCRIGRILPPHITRIQQKCAQAIIREGVMPIPDGIFE